MMMRPVLSLCCVLQAAVQLPVVSGTTGAEQVDVEVQQRDSQHNPVQRQSSIERMGNMLRLAQFNMSETQEETESCKRKLMLVACAGLAGVVYLILSSKTDRDERCTVYSNSWSRNIAEWCRGDKPAQKQTAPIQLEQHCHELGLRDDVTCQDFVNSFPEVGPSQENKTAGSFALVRFGDGWCYFVTTVPVKFRFHPDHQQSCFSTDEHVNEWNGEPEFKKDGKEAPFYLIKQDTSICQMVCQRAGSHSAGDEGPLPGTYNSGEELLEEEGCDRWVVVRDEGRDDSLCLPQFEGMEVLGDACEGDGGGRLSLEDGMCVGPGVKFGLRRMLAGAACDDLAARSVNEVRSVP